jgi:ABC-type transport system substrate-binding protein
MKTEEKIKELEKQTEELKKELQKEKMKQWFKSLLNGLKIEIDDNEPNSVYYKKNGRIFFELAQYSEERYFWCDYDLVWSILENKYNLNYYETQAFIKNMVEQHLKLGVVTPSSQKYIFPKWVEKNLKSGAVTVNQDVVCI